jgi:hypothetical protein
MEIKLSESQMAEIKIVEILHGLDISILEKEKIYVAVRDYGDLCFDEGDGQGWDNGFQAALNSQGAME